MKLNDLIAALTAIRDEHGDVDCRMGDDAPIRRASFVHSTEAGGWVFITDRDGNQEKEITS